MVKAKSMTKLGNKKSHSGKLEKTHSGKVTKLEGIKGKKKKVTILRKEKSGDHSKKEVRQELNGSKESAQKRTNSSDKLDKSSSGKVTKPKGTKGKKVGFGKKGKAVGQQKKEGIQKVNGVKKFPPRAATGRNLNKKGKVGQVRNDSGNIPSEKGPWKRKGKSKRFLRRATEGAIVITNLPHGFYEEEMLGFFKQFGVVTNLRLARSKKNGRPMGYAFVGFHVPEVAKIVANTLDGYLMFNKIMKCKYIPKSEIQIGMFKWKRRNATDCLGTERRIKAVQDLSKIQPADAEARRIRKLAKKVEKSKAMLKTLGVNLDLQTPRKPAKEKEQVTEDLELLKSLDMMPDQTKEEEDGGEFFMDNKQFLELKRKIAERLLADVEREDHENKGAAATGEGDNEEKVENMLLADVEREDHENKGAAATSEGDNEEKVENMDVQEAEKEEVSLTSVSKDATDSEAEEENSNLVLEVDESDDEVHIKTPPNFIKKKVKMTPSTPSTPICHDKPSSKRKTPSQNMSPKKKMKNQDSKAAGIGESGKKKKKKKKKKKIDI